MYTDPDRPLAEQTATKNTLKALKSRAAARKAGAPVALPKVQPKAPVAAAVPRAEARPATMNESVDSFNVGKKRRALSSACTFFHGVGLFGVGACEAVF